MAHYNRILAALDAGDTQLAIARRALSIAHDDKAVVLFAHVMDASDLEQARVDVEEYVATCKQAIESALEDQLATAAQDECIPCVSVVVKAGHVNDALGEVAKEFDPDLVVCGVRGLSNLKYALMGSVSTYLVRNMDCDVLVVRPEALDDAKEL